jgi:energy-coupling factor transporter ATP-binding protein EcfA2
MKILNIRIENFRGISNLKLKNLTDFIVIAGKNGSGKSSIFDAIRLLKSIYGGYTDSELDQWFGEFQLDRRDIRSTKTLFRNRNKKLLIEIDFQLTDDEKKLLIAHAPQLLRNLVLDTSQKSYNPFYAPPTQGYVDPRETREIANGTDILTTELKMDIFKAKLAIDPSDEYNWQTEDSLVLQIVFSTYFPQELGIVDYQGAHRNYSRERISGIQLNQDTESQRITQSALYNSGNKYSNVKSEMANAYIREMLLKRNNRRVATKPLYDTISELFVAFFPDKEFLKPVPDDEGNLTFPVRLRSGEVHDIDELSAGEKEIIYGYLRLRNKTPHNSILLLDEPELHLNPGLIHGLPQFYNKELGEVFNNQIWLITHSDAFLKESVGRKNYSVIHMKVPSKANSKNQAHLIDISESLDKALFDLTGDSSLFDSESTVVIFEGGGETEFDINMTNMLFPELSGEVITISGGDKKRVAHLHTILKEVAKKGKLRKRFFSIVDKDSDEVSPDRVPELLNWDVYHIENFLLEDEFILEACNLVNMSTSQNWTKKKISDELVICANDTLNELVEHKLRRHITTSIFSSVKIKSDKSKSNIVDRFLDSIKESEVLISSSFTKLKADELTTLYDTYKKELERDLRSDDWRKNFKGRSILTEFVRKNVKDVNYPAFANIIIGCMKNKQYKPQGMKDIIDKILTK